MSMIQTALDLAAEIGFSHAGPVNMEALIPRQEIREMCAGNRCNNYNRSWSCPPAPICGTPESMRVKMREYGCGILVQTTGQMADAYDLQVIREAEKKQKQCFDALVRQLRKMEISCFPMTSGGCTRCYACTWPDRPCRYPKMLYPSMEACGLWVSNVCVRSGLQYNYGENTITYTGCVLFEGEKKKERRKDERC